MAGTATVLGSAPVLHRSRGVVRLACTMLTDASGDMSAAVIGEAWGRIVSVEYDGGLDASASITLKDQRTGATLFGPFVTGTEGTPVKFRPSTNVVTDAGATIAAADTAPNVNRDIKVAGKVTLTVASGGNVETGKIAFIIDESVPGLGTKAVNV